MPDRDLKAEGRIRLQRVKPEHLQAFYCQEPRATARRLNTTGGVAELLRWFAENAAELLEVGDR